MRFLAYNEKRVFINKSQNEITWHRDGGKQTNKKLCVTASVFSFKNVFVSHKNMRKELTLFRGIESAPKIIPTQTN